MIDLFLCSCICVGDSGQRGDKGDNGIGIPGLPGEPGPQGMKSQISSVIFKYHCIGCRCFDS